MYSHQYHTVVQFETNEEKNKMKIGQKSMFGLRAMCWFCVHIFFTCCTTMIFKLKFMCMFINIKLLRTPFGTATKSYLYFSLLLSIEWNTLASLSMRLYLMLKTDWRFKRKFMYLSFAPLLISLDSVRFFSF